MPYMYIDTTSKVTTDHSMPMTVTESESTTTNMPADVTSQPNIGSPGIMNYSNIQYFLT